MVDNENNEIVLIEENVVVLTAIAVNVFQNRRIITDKDIDALKGIIEDKLKQNGISNVKYITYNHSWDTGNFIHFVTKNTSGYLLKPDISKEKMIDKYKSLVLEGMNTYDFLNYEKFNDMYKLDVEEKKELESIIPPLERHYNGYQKKKVKGPSSD